ncbi:MAG TPA: HAMP domain-containing protein [Clostridiales bacterium]|nr:HAMP domain-containing protein [Clostridiales bacterium]
MKLKSKIILSFLVLSGIALISVSLVSFFNIQEHTVQSIRTEMEAEINSITNQLNGWLMKKSTTVETTAEILKHTVGDGEISANYLQAYQQDPDISTIYIGFEKDGSVLDAKGWIPEEGYDARKRDWYSKAVSVDAICFSDPYIDAITGNPIVSAMIPIKFQNNELRGVLAADIFLTTLKEIVTQVSINGQGYGFLVDQNGIALAHPDEKLLNTNLLENNEWKELTSKMLESDRGMIEEQSAEKENLIVYQKIPASGWTLGIVLPQEVVYQPLKSIQATYIIINAIALILIFLAAWYLSRQLTKSVLKLSESAEIVSAGNLATEIEITSKDEIGQLGNSFKKMVENLRELIGHVANTSTVLGTSVEQMKISASESTAASEHTSQIMENLSEKMNQTSSSVEQVKQTIREIALSIGQVAESAQTASSAGQNAQKESQKGKEALQKAILKMNDTQQIVQSSVQATKSLEENSKKISSILQLISNIADQTNLLALNAAIEAARAGEQGRGFAVVAEEVRKLAEESSNASNQIAELLSQIQSEIHHTTSLMEQGREAVSETSQVVSDANNTFDEIHEAINQIASSTEDVSAATQQISAGSEEIVASMENVTEIAKESAVGFQQVLAATEEQMATMETLSSMAESLGEITEKLQNQIARFKI